MFNNIGKKIQSYAKVVFIVEIVVSVIVGMIATMVLRSVLYGDAYDLIPGIAFCIIGIGVFLAWLGQMRLYAYGKIAESCEIMMDKVSKMEAMQRAQLPPRKCRICGAVLDEDAVYCSTCGTKNEG